MALKSLAKKIIPEKYHWAIYNKVKNATGWQSKSYSALGEDLVISQLVGHKKNGFFVDVGAFDPQKYSNTHYFYRYFNWRGINIEPNPQAISRFEAHRPKDITLNMGVAKESMEMTYYEFPDPLYNTFSKQRVAELDKEHMKIVNTKTIAVKPLTAILDEHLKGESIDLLNVDVESLDLEVLQSLDFDKYQPLVICVEDHHLDIEKPQDSEIYNYLKSQGYKLSSKCFFTSLYSRIKL